MDHLSSNLDDWLSTCSVRQRPHSAHLVTSAAQRWQKLDMALQLLFLQGRGNNRIFTACSDAEPFTGDWSSSPDSEEHQCFLIK